MSTPHVVRGVQHGGTISERRGASPAVVFCCGYLPRRFTLNAQPRVCFVRDKVFI